MTIPPLQRIKISSVEELNTWLARNAERTERALLVTHSKPAHPKHVNRTQVQDALAAQGWSAGFRYTLNDTLVGHVVGPPLRAAAR